MDMDDPLDRDVSRILGPEPDAAPPAEPRPAAPAASPRGGWRAPVRHAVTFALGFAVAVLAVRIGTAAHPAGAAASASPARLSLAAAAPVPERLEIALSPPPPLQQEVPPLELAPPAPAAPPVRRPAVHRSRLERVTTAVVAPRRAPLRLAVRHRPPEWRGVEPVRAAATERFTRRLNLASDRASARDLNLRVLEETSPEAQAYADADADYAYDHAPRGRAVRWDGAPRPRRWARDGW